MIKIDKVFDIEEVYLELALFFNKNVYEEKLITYKVYIETENKILKKLNKK